MFSTFAENSVCCQGRQFSLAAGAATFSVIPAIAVLRHCFNYSETTQKGSEVKLGSHCVTPWADVTHNTIVGLKRALVLSFREASLLLHRRQKREKRKDDCMHDRLVHVAEGSSKEC
jgi:hypothetical protein